MNDPMDRLRAGAQRGAGPDRLDTDGVLARVREQTQGVAPGSLTHRRRTQTGAIGVAGVGALAVAGLLAAGVVTPGIPGSKVPATVAEATEPSPTSSPATSVPAAQGAAVTQSVALVKRSTDAVDAVDLDHTVLKTTTTDGVQHFDNPTFPRPSITLTVATGDGTKSRWTNVQASALDVAPATGESEYHIAIPGSKHNALQYYWLSPRNGIYTTFPWSGTGEVQGSLIAQGQEQVQEVKDTLQEVEDFATQDGVVVSGPTTATVGGRPARCVTLTDKNKQEGTVYDTVLDETRRTCFDASTRLPLLDDFRMHYQLDRFRNRRPSYSVTTTEYTWLPRDASSEKLLKPDLTGLRKVSKDAYTKVVNGG